MNLKVKAAGLAFAALLPVLLAAACGTAGNGANSSVKKYDNDGYLGITNTNPNLQMSPSYHTYDVDYSMMENAVTPIAGVRDVRIAANGTNANVKITADRALSNGEKERLRAEALHALQKAVPRYDYKVTIAND